MSAAAEEEEVFPRGAAEAEAEGDGVAVGLAKLPSTVAFFELPPRRGSAGFVLDFGSVEEPPDLSPRKNSTGEALDLITLLSTPPPPQDGARWWQPARDDAGGSASPSVTAEQDAHGVRHTLSELQLESLAARFHAVPMAEIRRTFEQFCALSYRSSTGGNLVESFTVSSGSTGFGLGIGYDGTDIKRTIGAGDTLEELVYSGALEAGVYTVEANFSVGDGYDETSIFVN